MKHAQKTRVILGICMLLIGIFSAYSLYKAFWPSAGSPYEVLTVEQAEKYMDFETGYALVDIRTAEEYEVWHYEGAMSIPYDTLVENAMVYLPDKTQMIYVYGAEDGISAKACTKLTGLGYASVTQIIGVDCPEPETEQVSERAT